MKVIRISVGVMIICLKDVLSLPTNRLNSQNTGQVVPGSNVAVPIPVQSGNIDTNFGGTNANSSQSGKKSVLPVPISDPEKDWRVKSFLDRIVSGAIKMIRLQSENISKITNSANIKKKLSDIKEFGKEMAKLDLKRVLNVEKIQPTGSSKVLNEVQPTPRALSEYSPANKGTEYIQEAVPQKIQSRAPLFIAPVEQAPLVQTPKAQQPFLQAQIVQDPNIKLPLVRSSLVQYPPGNEPIAQAPNYYPDDYQLN
ncbi:hypothetical protein AYI69_g783 [Smittium culicis]|uniref:Uncharacterized protein n=1 Tax=Smittium culicis TaxID=133412 RepID=A0A1R1YS51_9FUNG|nr:hypothetical protein AYI69_g783 [Smittium culicis]